MINVCENIFLSILVGHYVNLRLHKVSGFPTFTLKVSVSKYPFENLKGNF